MSAVLQFDDIHFSYPGHAPVLAGVDLDLAPGQRIAISGPNGAGKSTLLRLAMGLLRPSKGTIRALGQTCRTEADFREMRQRIGLVFQDPDDQLFCPTVAEDIAFGPLNQGKSTAEALAIVDEVLDAFDLMHLRDRITHHLSGGEKRLVSLACVMAMRPAALILDEPTNALDPVNEARLLSILQVLPQALLIVTHASGFRDALAPEQLCLVGGRLITPD